MNKSDKNQPQIDHFKCENMNYDLDKNYNYQILVWRHLVAKTNFRFLQFSVPRLAKNGRLLRKMIKHNLSGPKPTSLSKFRKKFQKKNSDFGSGDGL